MIDQEINSFILKQTRRLLQIFYLFRALVTGRRFRCNALSGTSDYSISVNCDMTVSCSCVDHDGSGEIGDLSKVSLKNIFNGSKSSRLRKSLARGILPLSQCATCPQLQSIPVSKAKYWATNYKLPSRGIMVENTVNCNYNCRSCPRSIIIRHRKKKKLSLDEVDKISRMLAEYQIKSLYYFKLGEVFLSPTILDEMRIIRFYNPDIEIKVETNGSVIDTDEKREAALMMNRVRVSIDGNNDRIVNKYQRNAKFSKSIQNIRNLSEYRISHNQKLPLIEWKYVVFNWNDREEMLIEAIEQAQKAGADGISFWPTVSPFYGFSWRYYFKLYSSKIRKYPSESFFVTFR